MAASGASCRFSVIDVLEVPKQVQPCYQPRMLKTRIKRRTAQTEQAASCLIEIQASITALADEDLLDLADIFAGGTQTPLWEIASTELIKRNLSL